MNAPPTPSAVLAASATDLAAIETPAFVYDEAATQAALDQLCGLTDAASARLLFSIKACALRPLLETIRKRVDGFSVSSWFESRLARTVLADKGSVHLTTPGLNGAELAGAAGAVTHVNFNSLGQWRRLRPDLPAGVQAGLRVNPQLPLVDDDRYNPCRPSSKLGVPLPELQRAAAAGLLSGLDGLHFHSHCESLSYAPLIDTIDRLEAALPGLFGQLRWVNLGGGYYAHAEGAEALAARIRALRDRHGVEVYIEPGKAVVGAAGSVVTRVVDLFDSDGSAVAVLDTSVNHQPEVFEYSRVPPVAQSCASGAHRYLLVGGTCLAGDLFGEYRFAEPLAIGSPITFTGVGAYSFAKAHRFNGHNLPSLYMRDAAGQLQLIKRFDYDDYAAHWGA